MYTFTHIYIYLHVRVGEIGGKVGAEADAGLGDPVVDELLQAGEGAPADEQDVARVHLDEVRSGILAASVLGDVNDGSLGRNQEPSRSRR